VRGGLGLGASAAGLTFLGGCELVPTGHEVKKVPRVGFVTGLPTDTPWIAPLWSGLRELGWIEGETVAIERRAGGTGGDPVAIAELLSLAVEVLVTVGTANTLAAKRATTTTSIVFTSVNDPVGVGVVSNLARPDRNVTGVSQGASTSVSGKQFELLRAIVPGLTRLVFIAEASNPVANGVALTEIKQTTPPFGVGVRGLEVSSSADLTSAFEAAAECPADGVIIWQSGLILTDRAHIAELAAGMHLPAMYPATELVYAGGLVSYLTSDTSLHRHADSFVDKLRRGAKPADLPVEQLTTIAFAVNKKTAQGLGLTIPPDVAAQVTEWVQ
jgi:putative tryptophan/tyrosine transport system substrate-binding protein